MGFEKRDSVVTVICTYPPVANMDHWSVTADEYLRWWEYLISPNINSGGPCNPRTLGLLPVVVLCPEHAELVSAAGWTKERFQKELWERVRIPLSAWPKDSPKMDELAEKIGQLSPETMVPLTIKPEQLLVVIGGGEGKHSHYFAPFTQSMTISKKIG